MKLVVNFFRPLMAAVLLVAAGGWLLPDPLQAQVTLSTLVDGNRAAITSDNFANLISTALISNGVSNVKDAKFFFQECFGGGMLTPLETSLGNTVSWVGGSSAGLGPSRGQISEAENLALPVARQFPANSLMVANTP